MSTHKQTAVAVQLPERSYSGIAGAISAQAADLPNAQELLQLLGVDQKELASLDQGKTVDFFPFGNTRRFAIPQPANRIRQRRSTARPMTEAMAPKPAPAAS